MHVFKSSLIAVILSVFATAALAGDVELSTQYALNLDTAKFLAKHARAHANENEWDVNIAIVDDAGLLVYFERGNTVQPGSIEVAMRKARTAVNFKRPTSAFSDGLDAGAVGLLTLPDTIQLAGGVPIVWKGQYLGAVGVSGVTSDQDAQIATAAIDALIGQLGE
ncbi:MAG: GlcG/HbpS family heme-binding protein [Lysobacterales bacterium]